MLHLAMSPENATYERAFSVSNWGGGGGVPVLCMSISLVPRPNPHAGKRVWCTSSDFLGFQDAK